MQFEDELELRRNAPVAIEVSYNPQSCVVLKKASFALTFCSLYIDVATLHE